MFKKKKHYLLYGHGGAYNHGAEAITKRTIGLLRQISPNCYITLSDHFPEQDQEFGLQPDKFVTRDMRGKTNEEIYRTTLETITSGTTAIHIGGDNYCYRNWQRYALISQTTKQRGGRSILWGCSITPECIDAEMLEALKKHDLILARENLTYNALQERGLSKVIKVSDIAFTLDPLPSGFLSKNPYVVLNLSPLVCTKNPAILPAFHSLVQWILHETDYDIVLLPHVVMPMDNDCEVLYILKAYSSNRIIMLPDNWNAAQYKDVISQAALCVAARTHVCIAAYGSCVPCLALGYSAKAWGIAGDLGMLDYVIGCSETNITIKLLTMFSNLILSADIICKDLSGRMDEYRAAAVPDDLKEELRRP